MHAHIHTKTCTHTKHTHAYTLPFNNCFDPYFSSAVIDAQLPTSLTAETIRFPSDPSIFSGPNTSTLQIVIPRETILFRFGVEG